MRKLTDTDAGNLYAMKVLKKATLKGELRLEFSVCRLNRIFSYLNIFIF